MSYQKVQFQPICVSNLMINGTIDIEPTMSIIQIVLENTTANAVVGGINIGTTSGGSDVIQSLPVSGTIIFAIPESLVLKKIFSMSAVTTLYIQAATLWNSASLNFYFVLRKVNS